MRTLDSKGDGVRAPNENTKKVLTKGKTVLPVNQSHPLLGLSPKKMRIKKSQAGNPALQEYLQ